MIRARFLARSVGARTVGIMVGLLALGVFYFAAPAFGAANVAPKRVLILDSFGRDIAPFNAVSAAFRTTLALELAAPVDIDDAPFDTARFADPRQEGPFVDFLQHRFAKRKLDLVVPINFPALRFTVQHRNRLFPETPMLIAATDQRRVRPEFLTANTAVVPYKVNLPGTVEGILQVLPDTKNIVVVLGASALEKFWVAELRKEFERFTNRVSFTWFNELSFQDMKKKAAAQPPHSAILYDFLMRDSMGVPYSDDAALKSLSAVANAPIFVFFESQFGKGVVGGSLLPDRSLGVEAARVAVRILRGEVPSSIQTKPFEASTPVYDWRELRRWGISESRLPQGSIVQFREPTFWQQYKWIIILALTLCILEAIIIDVLVRERRRRRSAQQGLDERLRFERLLSVLSNVFINLPAYRVETEIQYALGRVAQLLAFDIATLSVFKGRPTESPVAHIWKTEGVLEILPALTVKNFPWSTRELLAGRDVCLPSLDALPQEAHSDREAYEKYHVRSSFNVPLVAGGEVIGVLGLNTVWAEREMPRELFQCQRLLGEIFANALARKAAEESLRDSEQNFRRLVETTAAVPWQADIETWVFTYVGPQAVKLLGYPFEHWYEKDFWVSHLHPDDKEFAINTCLALSKSAEDFEFEYRMIDSSGKTVWVHDIVRCEHRNGKPAQLGGFMLDITERKLADGAVRESEERFRTMANTAPVMIWMSGVDTLCTFFNKGWLNFTGRTLEQELGNGWTEGVHREDFDRCIEIYVNSFNARQEFTMEYRLRRHEGDYCWVLDHGVPRLASDGTFLGYIGTVIDISELKRGEEKFRLAVEASPSAIVMVNEQGHIVLVNVQTEKLFGYSREELIGQSVELLVPKRFHNDHPGHRKDFSFAPQARRMGVGRDLFARRKDGSEFLVEIGLNPIHTNEGILVLTAIVDVTERKRTAEALEKERAFLRQVIDIDPNFIFAKDREGRFTLVNQAVAETYGTTVENLIGKTDADFNRNLEEVEHFRQMDLEVIDTLQERFIPEEHITDFQGKVRWLQTMKRPIIEKDGSANQILGAATDITRRKEAESELQHNRQELAHVARLSAMGELAASLAHELNQPLTAILANAQAAQRFMAARPADLAEVREILKDIVQDNNRAGEIIRRIRALVKKEQLEFAPVDLTNVISDVLLFVHSDAVLHNVRVSLDLNPDLPPARGDKVQLQQVILNLMLNAVDAMKACPVNERELVVRAQRDGAGMVKVAVCDRGTGLGREKLDKIFQPFYTTKRDGLGMGLSISRSIIEAHGGRLLAENNADRGATFYFTVAEEKSVE